jgi:uncharacterized protein YbdZ (MbtH family)
MKKKLIGRFNTSRGSQFKGNQMGITVEMIMMFQLDNISDESKKAKLEELKQQFIRYATGFSKEIGHGAETSMWVNGQSVPYGWGAVGFCGSEEEGTLEVGWIPY